MSAPFNVPVGIEMINPWAEVFASWVRTIEGASIENRPKLLAMMARDAAAYADGLRQQVVDDLWLVTEGLGLVDLLGFGPVQDAITSGFAGVRS